MTTKMKFLFNEEYSIDRPLLFNGSNYISWKVRIKIFIQAHDYNLWKIIVNGLHTPNALIEYDKEKIQLNAKVINLLYCLLDINVFNAIFLCISATYV